MDTLTNPNAVITDKDFFKYPNIESFKEKLAELKTIDFNNTDNKEIEETIFSYLTVVPSLVGKYVQDQFNQFKFYRVRLNVNDQTEDLKLIRTYSYPLPQFCKENGRANLKNKSVFYSTNSALTAIIESKPKVGDIGYLSVWEGNTDREMKAGVLLPKNLNAENEWYLLAKDIYSFVDKNIEKVAMQKSNFFHEALNFIADLFLNEHPPYPITSCISNGLIYGSAWKDFIIYPSFANKAFTSNFAIHPNVADKYLRFIKVIRFKVIEINDERFLLSTGRVGEIVQNNIEWRTATKEEIDFSLF
jgi:hypothetical protein